MNRIAPPISPTRVTARSWVILALGVAAQTAGTLFVSTPAFLIPLLHTQQGLSLAEAGFLASIPTLGMVLTLVAWGALTDLVGEKWVLAGGLLLTAGAALGAILSDGYVALGIFLLLGGMASASTNSASGRLVVGWFPKERRGLAMGIRQMSQPLGVTLAALVIPATAATGGIPAAISVSAALTAILAVACAIGIVNPERATTIAPAPRDQAAPRKASSPNPYRRSSFLLRIHSVSALLVVPQFVLSTFGLVWIVTELRWDPLPAGIVVGLSQFVGALGRIAIGVLSDQVGSRVRPLRWVSIAASAIMLLLAVSGATAWPGAAIVFIIATTVTVADNGLAFTSVAEMAGSSWSGKALGIQNTGQFLAASAVGPLFGALIGVVGYPLAFAAAALFPAIATPLIPSAEAEHDRL